MQNKDYSPDENQENPLATTPSPATPALAISRRRWLQATGGSGMAAMLGGLGNLFIAPTASAEELGPLTPDRRRYEEYWLRSRCARSHFEERRPPQESNGDEELYDDKRGNFSKCLPHNEFGEVDQAAYQSLRNALASGDPQDFEAIVLAPDAGLGTGRRLANPQAAYAFEMTGIGTHATRIAPPPAFASAAMAAEMAEVYWQALTRDIPFERYESDALVNAAVEDLNRLSVQAGPTESGRVTPRTLFRGSTAGDLVGPYLSQFLWLPIPYGMATIDQRYRFPVADEDFGTDYAEWLALQRGAIPTRALSFDSDTRYIASNRDLGQYVHVDFPFQAFFNAGLIMMGFGVEALAPENPYRDSFTQEGFVTFGVADINHLVTKAADTAMKSAWYQKWLVHRRVRPEVYAGRIENQRRGRDYGLPDELLLSDAVARLVARNGNALLPLAYPEGSPTHPSYPAGHATFSGACATVLKALFNEDYLIDAVQPSADGTGLEAIPSTTELTLGGEINKLAHNIALARDAAGVHYRADGAQGLLAGEQQALGLLQDYSKTYNEDFPGFFLTRFDGTPVQIVDGRIVT
ncbi:MAG: vanadium-dependent haloperoxidase [Gammaproteobacteria bacterium]|nr:vanadium-dependent haloperoxidase [Gammaproteobacteria bacterium]